MEAAQGLSPLVLSLRSAALAVLLVTPAAFLAADRVRRWRGSRRAAADLLLLSPLVLPPTVLGFVLLQLLGRYGPLGEPLARLGLELVFSWPATVLSAAMAAFPLIYRTLLAALEQLDPGLEAVARSLGAGPWRVWRRITLPLVLPGLGAGLSLGYARALGEFGTTLMLAGNIPGRTQTLPLAIYAAVDAGDLPQAWVWTGQVLLLNGLCLALVQLFLSRGRRPGLEGATAPESLPVPLPPAAPAIPAASTAVAPGPFALRFELHRRHGGFRFHLALDTACRRLAILGPSGAGKSLLLRLLAGLERPQAGWIELNGRVLFDAERGIDLPPERRRIAVMLQHDALFPHLSVAANVAFGLAHLPPAERQARVAAQLAAVGLLEQARHYPAQLSGGQQQRAALARALVTEPDLLLLDEPLSSQDAHRRRRLQQLMEDLLARSAVPTLLVTHDMEEAYRLCEELLVIDRGARLRQGPRWEVFERPGAVAVARLTGCKNISAVQRLGPTRLRALAWGMDLETPEPLEASISHVGMRAHHLELATAPVPGASHHWPCRVVRVSEGPLHVTVFVVPEAAPLGAVPPQPILVELRRRAWKALGPAAATGPLVLSLPVGCLLTLQ
ncbi:molybdate ABC transporter permease subunit [Cyanobium sp. N5-Cardenillas]|uniref:molybdate ABC transporter permease subunit n=1 Tax=Cyanobium sp. N5-Cardenillas TaxID=2823720 RepID=UPI0020CEF1B9|nr:molybdate ABC transporter permease subunit [Cyanobium sp. N5-Cardenillas]MCP9785519.1 molybdate ABC transporter permease subunit [Cyanobium sp. N5-Cardenillas]